MEYEVVCRMAGVEAFLKNQAEIFGGEDDEDYIGKTECYYKNERVYSRHFFRALASGLVDIIQGEPLIGIVGWVEKYLMNSGSKGAKGLTRF